MATVPLTKGLVALVDDRDLPTVVGLRWQAAARSNGNGWYAKSSHVLMHRLLMPGVGRVDHVNGDGLDNRRENLRPATQSQNLANQRPCRGGSSRFKGVHWDRAKQRWMVTIRRDGRTRYVGRYDREVEAARAYNTAAVVLFGEYARLNQVEEAA